jgi:hypothetical protein
MTSQNPNADPAVQAAYAAYLDAWVGLANMPGVSERSVAQAAEAQEARNRLREAETVHYEACQAANPTAHPEPEPEAEP